MKRDMDLIRSILFEIEKHEHGRAPKNLKIDGFTEEQTGYHVHLMGEAGLLRVIDTTHMQSPSPSAIPIGLTWEGCDFLEAARSKTIWNKAKEKMSQAGVGFTLVLLKELLVNLTRKALDI